MLWNSELLIINKDALSGKSVNKHIKDDYQWDKMKNILDNNTSGHSFLFSAKSGGCNGFNYKLETIDKSQYDIITKINHLYHS